MANLSRRQLLVHGGKGAGALLVAGGIGALGPGPASAAASETDLAWVRLGISLEYVNLVYWLRAGQTGVLGEANATAVQRATAAERLHLKLLADALIAQGQQPIEGVDLEPAFPEQTFKQRQTAIAVGRRIERLAVRTYLGALTSVQDAAVRLAFVKVVPSEVEHLALFNGLASGVPLTAGSARHYDIGRASDELTPFLP